MFPAAFIDDADRIKASPMPSLWLLLLSDLENILLTIHANGDQDVNLDSCVSRLDYFAWSDCILYPLVFRIAEE